MNVYRKYSFAQVRLRSDKYSNATRKLPMNDDRDVRDRLARAEQNILNNDQNFRAFKTDDFASLKTEVHSMRGELNRKVDELRDLMLEIKEAAEARTQIISITMAKWMGAGGVLIFIGQFLLDKFV